MAIYNLETVKSPRLCGRLLDLFSRVLRLPILGRLIVELIKKRNGVDGMVRFATGPHAFDDDEDPRPLMPLYYPIHEMGADEAEMHRHMAEDRPLDLRRLSEMTTRAERSESGGFRHWTVADYTGRYADGTITPSEVAERLIRAIEEMNARNNNRAVVTQMNARELRTQAAESTERYRSGKIAGVLDGVPILVKDEIPTVGFPVTLGTSFVADAVREDAFPILKLKREGALIAGKTNQHEIGIGTTGFNLLHGTPKNPYGRDRDVHYLTGGSSSGSAAAVAMGLVPIALGGDGGGSIRVPSGLCGCVGLKPTFKRIAIDGTMGCSVFHAGPMASNANDAALAYAIMAGGTDGDHRRQSRKQPPVHLHACATGGEGSALEGLRIGVFEEHATDAEHNVVDAFRRAVEYYGSRGARIVPVILPHLQEIHLAHGVTITTEMYSLMSGNYHSGRFDELCPESRVSLAIGRSWSAAEFLAAQKVRNYAVRQVEDLFEHKVDVILSPATPCVAPILRDDALSHGESNLPETSALMRYMIHGNLTGIPAIVFPVAYDDETSLPISLQVQAAHWREDLLLAVARESEGILEKGVARPSVYVDVLGSGDSTMV